MIFTSPLLLWALPLAAAPLLLHLIARRRAARVPFSDLTFLRKIYARSRPLTRLRQWLLVAVRCLILFCLVLSYAGPMLRAQGGAEGQGGVSGLDLVLLLDVSYSMGYQERGKSRFQAARLEAESLLRNLKPTDRVSLIPFSDRVELQGKINWAPPRQGLEALARVAPGFRGTDYAPALKAAAELLSGDSRRRRAVLVLSDGARHGFRGPPPVLERDIAWLGLQWPPARNAAVNAAGPSRQSNARRPELSVRTQGAASGSPLDLWLSDRRVQSSALKPTMTLALPPAQEPSEPAWSGRVALRPDALSADDAYYFSFRHPARPRLLCLYGNPEFFKAPGGGYFLREVFGGAKESLLEYECDFLELGRFNEARLSDYNAVILADFKDIPAGAASELDRFVRRGGGLWVIPGARTDAEALSPMNSWLPAQFGALVWGEGAGLKPGPQADLDFWKGFELGKVMVGRYYLLQVRPGAAVRFKSASGYPLLVTGSRGEGRVAVWASALDASWTNLALKPLFALWIQDILDGICPGSKATQSYDLRVGEPLVRVWQPQEPAPASVRLRAPDGGSTTLWLKDRRVEYGQTAVPGLYTLVSEGSGNRNDSPRRDVYAVNLDRSFGESDLTPLRQPPWRQIRIENLSTDFWREVYGRDARGALVGLAAAWLLLEMFLSLPRASAAVFLLGWLLAAAGAAPASAQSAAAGGQGDRLVWSQLKLGPQWDPYPDVHTEILGMLSSVTSVLSWPERRVLTLKDKNLFFSPLVVLAGRQAPSALDEEELSRLRQYLLAGGLLWIEDISGAATSSFDSWVRRTLAQALPESALAPLPLDHVIFKTFFLLRATGGRARVQGTLEGVSWAGRTAVVYSRNDLLGVWPKDALGNPLYACPPGGEAQRLNGKKLAVNIIMYALTGNYKADAVHQPFLLQKMRSGVP